MGISFSKFSGAGNTFVLIDDRQRQVATLLDRCDISLDRFVMRACSAAHGAGSDGLILIQADDEHAFRWRFFNSDGGTADMCGNGARCAARYAQFIGIPEADFTFATDVGPIRAHVGPTEVRVSLPHTTTGAQAITLRLGSADFAGYQVDVGVPHLVFPVADVADIDVPTLGEEARYHPTFSPAGVNVNFSALQADGTLRVRTYERGVERETLACGTGVTAAALVAASRDEVGTPVTVLPISGEALTVSFSGDPHAPDQIALSGSAHHLLSGELADEAFTA